MPLVDHSNLLIMFMQVTLQVKDGHVLEVATQIGLYTAGLTVVTKIRCVLQKMIYKITKEIREVDGHPLRQSQRCPGAHII